MARIESAEKCLKFLKNNPDEFFTSTKISKELGMCFYSTKKCLLKLGEWKVIDLATDGRIILVKYNSEKGEDQTKQRGVLSDDCIKIP